jgi:hypothetical protein
LPPSLGQSHLPARRESDFMHIGYSGFDLCVFKNIHAAEKRNRRTVAHGQTVKRDIFSG